jgi:uncharacterized membrane protein YfhO
MSLASNDLYIKKDYNCLFYIDWAVFEDAMAKLATVQYDITDYTESSFKGTITTPKDDQNILTTLPYDEGWRVYVDGKRVEIFESLDALVSFKIDAAGEHDVKLVYLPTAFTLGLSVTVISILVFVLLIFKRNKLIIRSSCKEDAQILQMGAEDTTQPDASAEDSELNDSSSQTEQ